jgi:SAM-dependent methyltransferase
MSSPLDIFWALIDPIKFLLYTATYIPSTIFNLLTSLQIRALITPSLFKDAWFANFWRTFGPQSRENATPRAAPLMALASGVVLDIGPGSGEWVFAFDKSKVTKIYGVEPNKDHHGLLKQRVKTAGLEEVYVICPVGVEELSQGKGMEWEVAKESVDCVVTIQCLCSVPQPRKMMGELYGYLKEGGTWILYEHVVVFEHQGGFMKWYQGELFI